MTQSLGPAALPPVTDRDFPGRLPGEEVLLVTTRHRLFYVTRLWPVLLAAAGAVALLAWLVSSGQLDGLWSPWLVAVLGLLAFAAFWTWAMWEEFRNDVFIVTDRRVIALRRVYRMFEHRQEADLARLQDVSVTVGGVLPFLCGFGDVMVATASSGGGVRMQGIPRPDRVRDVVFEASQALAEQAWLEEQRALHRRLREELGAQ